MNCPYEIDMITLISIVYWVIYYESTWKQNMNDILYGDWKYLWSQYEENEIISMLIRVSVWK